MKLGDLAHEPEVTLDLAPLIDVLFLIVLFYAVTSSLISPRELSGLKGDLEALTADKRTLMLEIDQTRGAVSDLESRLSHTAAALAGAREDAAQRATRIADLDGRLASALQTIERQTSRLTDQEAFLTDERERRRLLESELSDRSATLAERMDEIARMLTRVDRLEADLAASASAGTAKGTRITALEQDLTAAAALLAERRQEVTALKARIATLEAETSQGRSESASAAETITTQQRRLAALQADAETAVRDVGSLQASVDDLQQRLAEREARISALEAALGSREVQLKTGQGQLSEMERSVMSLRAELALAQTELGRTGAAIVGRDQQATDLHREIETLRAALTAEQEGRRKDMAAADARLARLRAEMEAVQVDQERQGLTTGIAAARLREMIETERRVNESLRTLIEQRSIGVERSGNRLVLKLSNEVLFDSASAELKRQGLPLLAQVGEALRGTVPGLQILIGGHTDNVPFSNARRYKNNWELSAARAVSVVEFLERTSGVDPRRLSAVGYGEFQPVSDNEAPEGRARNRRIEIVLIPR